jgi:hypothetical protein
MRKCIKCKQTKDLSQFYKRDRGRWYQSECKNCVKEARKVRYYKTGYIKTNWELTKRKDHERKKIKTDIGFRLKKYLRNRLRAALHNNWKKGSSVRDLGCSIEKFKLWLEMKFKDGMTWANQGEWHIDHKIPLSHFDLTDREQLLKACHYTNLQPLWAEENFHKYNKLDGII